MIKLEKQGFLVVPSIRDVKYLKYTLESQRTVIEMDRKLL